MRTYVYSKQEELERLLHYGDKDLIPTDESYFELGPNRGIRFTDSSKANASLDGIAIPYKYDGESIWGIDENAFSNCSQLHGISLPNNIGFIKSQAFVNCCNLMEITLPDNLSDIGSSAFMGCSSLETIIIPKNVYIIPSEAFCDCSRLTNVRILNGVQLINKSVFKNCTSLESIIIPDTVRQIENNAFSGCNFNKLTIICSQGSYADTFAKENGIKVKYNVVSLDKLSYKTFANSETLVLNHNQEARSDETITELILSVQDNISDTYHSTFSFTTGDSITIAYPVTPIIWKGDDCDNEGLFNPEPNTGYEISIKRLGNRTVTEDGVQTILPNLVARVGVY